MIKFIPFSLTVFFWFVYALSSFAQKPDWDAVIDRYYEKYQVQETPDWIFPLVLKNGWDERDTIYFIWEEGTSKFDFDSILGEYYIPIDSAAFSAFWWKCPSNLCDSLLVNKVKAINLMDSNLGKHNISMRWSKLPITIYFNTQLFHDVPFAPDLSPAPDAQGLLYYDLGYQTPEPWSCGGSFPISITDSSITEHCYFTDSVEIFSVTPDDQYFFSYLQIQYWFGGDLTNTADIKNENDNNVILFPNPSNGYFDLESQSFKGKTTVKIFNITGQMVYSLDRLHLTSFPTSIDVCHLPKGLYFLLVESQNQKWSSKLFISD